MDSAFKIYGTALIVIAPLVAAAWLPPGFPHLFRQLLLCIWGLGSIVVAERLLYRDTLGQAIRAVGFKRPRLRTIVVACLVSLPMWAFLPLRLWAQGVAAELRPDWLPLLLGVVLVNGLTEEAIHRGFVFGHLRRGRSFALAATSSAAVFAAQHLYIIATSGWTIGLASVGLAALLSYPMAFVFERGGNSIAGPALLHTSSNAPVMIFAMPEELLPAVVLPHMAVVLMSLYLLFTPAFMPRPR